LLAYFFPAPMIRAFSNDPNVISFGGEYLHIVALNFIAAGVVFTTSSIFQGLGNTLPPLFSSMTRLFLFILPAILLSRMPGFQIRYVWYLSVVSQSIQACINLLLLWRELQHKLSKALASDIIAPGGAIAS